MFDGLSDSSSIATELVNSADKKVVLEKIVNALSSADNAQIQESFGSIQLIKVLLNSINIEKYEDCTLLGFQIIVKLLRLDAFDKSTANLNNLNRCDEGVLNKIVETTLLYINNELVVYNGCLLMMILAADSEERQRSFLNCKGAAVIITILKEYILNSKIAEIGCRVIRNFSVDDEMASELVSQGVGEILVQLIKENIACTNVTTIESILWAIVNLSYDEDVAALLGSNGCCQSILDIISPPVFPYNLSIDTVIVWAIRNLSCPRLNLLMFTKSLTICDWLANTLQFHFENNNIQIINIIIWSINNLCSDSNFVSILYDKNIPQLIIHICKTLFHTIIDDIIFGPIGEATMFTVRSLANSMEHNIILTGLGVGEFLCDILRRYNNREGMVEGCCLALSNLSRKNEEMQSILSTYSVIEILIMSIKSHKFVLQTIEFILTLLTVLIEGNISNKSQLIDQSGIILTVQLMRIHQTDYDVVTLCCELLLQLYYVDEQAREKLKSENQLSDDGLHARPAGRYADIALAWDIETIHPQPAIIEGQIIDTINNNNEENNGDIPLASEGNILK
eukprot:gene5445-7538_t